MEIFCFSHLRWNFVYQRPQHIVKRLALRFRVFYVEEPFFHTEKAFLEKTLSREGIWIVVPHLPPGLTEAEIDNNLHQLLEGLIADLHITYYTFWYYTPMALAFTRTFRPQLTIYDCMDELSAFKFAPPELKEAERKLFEKADIVFTGGYSLYHAKKHLHHNIYPFPSSIDKEHFAKARIHNQQPADQEDEPAEHRNAKRAHAKQREH